MTTPSGDTEPGDQIATPSEDTEPGDQIATPSGDTEPGDRLATLIDDYARSKSQRWDTGRFRAIKALSATEKGNIAEDFVRWLGEHNGFEAERHRSRRGPWDVRVAGFTIEVKMATQDVNGAFQFNGIRYDYPADLIFVLGIAPDEVWFNLYARRDLFELTLVPMRKNANSDFKLTRTPEQLLAVGDFRARFEEKTG